MKRSLALLLALVMVLGLCACGEQAAEGTPSVKEPTEPVNIWGLDSSTELADKNYTLLQENAPDVSAQRDAILNSETNIVKGDTFIPGETYTGTAYYVSNSGNDNNSGTSPEQAWATLDRVDAANFRRGDAVFFERGGIWYGRIRPKTDELTISAYGEGPKPIVSGNDPDLMVAENWTEHGKTPDGGTVWVYNKTRTDVSHVLLNGGETVAVRMTPKRDDNGYVDSEGKPFDVLAQLTEDKAFFCEVDFTGWELSRTIADEYHPAKLYLRCDAGNPAETFDQIWVMYNLQAIANEFCGTVVDNLNIQYFGTLAVSSGLGRASTLREEYGLVPSVTLQNCEVSYCGGSISNYNYNVDGDNLWRPGFSGAVIHFGNGDRALNNYIHDVASKVFVVAYHGWPEQGDGYENITISGNLLVNNCQAFHITDYSYSIARRDYPCYFKNIEISDNTVLFSGYSWARDLEHALNGYPWNPSMACIELCGNKHPDDSIRFTNNLFYGAELCLVFNPHNRDNKDEPGFDDVKEPVFSGNIYVQYSSYAGLLVGDLYPASMLEEYVRDVLGDATGTVIGVE